MSEERVDLSQSEFSFKFAEDLAFAVEVENVSDQPIRLLDTRYGDSSGSARSDWFGQFLFTIDFFDKDGAKVKHPEIQLIGSSTPVSRTRVETVEPGGKHRFLLRPMNWLSVMMPRLKAGSFQAVVHYHGLPIDASENLSEYRPESALLGSWSGNVSSMPTAFELSSPANDFPTEASWGEESDGLRAALEVSPNKPSYVFGERPDVKLHLLNVSETPITLATVLGLSNMHANARNEQDEEAEVHGSFFSGWRRYCRFTLQPQQTIALDAGNIAVAANREQAMEFRHVAYRTLVGPVGGYHLQLSGEFGRGFSQNNGRGKKLVPLEGDWSGELTTGFTPIVVASN